MDRHRHLPLALGAPLVVGAVLLATGAAPGSFFPVLVAATATWLLACAFPPSSARVVFVVAAAARLAFLASSHHSDDVHRYVLEGRMVLEGINPYAVAPDDAAADPARTTTAHLVNHPQLPSIYPPLAQAFFAVTAALGLEEVGVKNVVLCLDVAVVALILRWLRSTGRRPGWAAIYAWSPLAVGTAATGHLDPLMLLTLVGFLWAFERGARGSAGVLLGLSVLAKLVPALLLPFVLLRSRRVATVAVATVVAGYLPFAVRGDPFGSLVPFATDFSFHAALPRVLDAVLPAPAVRPALALLLGAGTLAIAVAEPRAPRALLLTTGWVLLLSPTVHLWYWTVALVALPGIGPRPLTMPFLAVGAACLPTVATYVRAHHGGPFVEDGLSTGLAWGLPVLVALALAWRHRPRRAPLAASAPPGARLPSFAVLIPARGERVNLETLLPRWLATPAAEVVVADTPTGDGTEDLVRRLDRTRYVPVAARGYGAAVAAAWEAALASPRKVEAVVVADADDPTAPDHHAAILSPLADARVGLVTGARLGGRLGVAQRLGNRLACALLALFFGRRFRDLGPLRAWRVDALSPGDVADRGYGWNVELNVRALERGLEVVEVPVTRARRPHGTDAISGTWRGVVRAGHGILRRLFALREASCARRW